MLHRTFPLAASLAALLAASIVHAAPADPNDPNLPRLKRILAKTPLIDGHNDWAETLLDKAKDKRWTIDLRTLDTTDYDTDITRLRQGLMGGQFWSVYVSANLPELQQVKDTLDQIDLVKSIVARYPQDFALARTAADVRAAHKAGRIASMLGAEGGGQIDGSFSVLRAYHDLGVGYLTLTHSKTIAWADSATDNPAHDGLTPFGIAVVKEMNRLGMLVDLSHVSEKVMLDALTVTKAPVIFSHSSARAICNHSRNVSDAVLAKVAANGGIVMVNFAPNYISEARRVWGAARGAEQARNNLPPFGGLHVGEPDKAKAALAAWDKANPEPKVTLGQVADHIDHIAKVAGYDNVGLGGDYDGLPALPEGMEGVESYPPLLLELMKRGWSDANIAKLAGGNILRVMAAAEKVAASMKDAAWASGTVESLDSAGKTTTAETKADAEAQAPAKLEIVLTRGPERRLLANSGDKVLLLSGRLHNPGSEPVEVRPVQARLLDAAGMLVHSWQIIPDLKRIPARSDATFNAATLDVPESATSLVLEIGDGDTRIVQSLPLPPPPA